MVGQKTEGFYLPIFARWDYDEVTLLTLSKHTVCSPNHEIKYEWKNKLVPEDEANSAFWDE